MSQISDSPDRKPQPQWIRLRTPPKSGDVANEPPPWEAPLRELAPLDYNRSVWKDKPLLERMDHLIHLVVMHPQFVRGLNAVRQRREMRKLSGKGLGLHIIGRSNGGKTTFMRYIHSMLPPIEKRDRSLRPFVGADTPNPVSNLGISNAFLESMGAPDCVGGKHSERRDQLLHLWRVLETEVIALDNVQDVPEFRGYKGLRSVAAHLRTLVQKSGTCAIFLGTEAAEIVIDTYDQVKRRAPGRLYLGNYMVNTPTGMSEYLRFVDEYDKSLPLTCHSNLANNKERTGHAIAIASDGEPGATQSLMLGALVHAHKEGNECLLHEHFNRAYCELYLEYSDVVNPFKPDFDFNRGRLNKPGEPHFVDLSDWTKRRGERGKSGG